MQLGLLPAPPGDEDRHRGRIEVDAAAGVGCLATGLVQLVVDGDQPAVDGEGGRLLVEVLPPESEELAPAHAGERRHPEGREQPVPCSGSQERLEFLGGPRRLIDPGDRPQGWSVGDQRDVAGDESAAVDDRVPPVPLSRNLTLHRSPPSRAAVPVAAR
jgi:hypothetical protein